jgi:hypothetical protein
MIFIARKLRLGNLTAAAGDPSGGIVKTCG